MNQIRLRKMLSASLAFAATFYLATIVLYSWHNRISADDYQALAKLRILGFFGTHLDVYRNWIGRWSAGILQLLFSQLYMDSGRPFVFDLVTFFFFTWSVIRLYRGVMQYFMPQARKGKMSGEDVWVGAFLANLIYFSIPLSRESFLWVSGSVCYAWGLSLLFHCIASILKGFRRDRQGWLEATLCSAWLAGCNETLGAFWLLVLLVLLMGVLVGVRKKGSWIFVTGVLGPLLACLASYAVVALAPGNAVRKATMHYESSLGRGISTAFEYLFPFLRDLLGHGLYWYPLAGLLVFLSVQFSKEGRSVARLPATLWRVFWSATAAALLLVGTNFLLIFPSVYLSGGLPPIRSWATNVAVNFMIVIVFSAYVSSKISLKRQAVLGITSVVALLGIGLGLYRGSLLKRQIGELVAYSNAFDQRLELMQKEKAKGRREVLVVEPLPYTDLFQYCEWDVSFFRGAFDLPFDVKLVQKAVE